MKIMYLYFSMLEAATVSQFSFDIYCIFTFQHNIIEVKLGGGEYLI
jgi:hypothetical protein